MRTLLTILLFSSLAASAQKLTPVSGEGFKWKRGAFDYSFRLPRFASDPFGPYEVGSQYYNTTDNTVRYFNGTVWYILTSAANFQSKLPEGTPLQYYRGNGTLGNFPLDAYNVLRPYFQPIDSSVDVTRINGFTGAVRNSITISGPGVTGNPATGNYYIDTSRGGGGTPTLQGRSILANRQNNSTTGTSIYVGNSLVFDTDTLKINKDSVLGLTRTISVDNVAALRSSTLFANGARLALTRGYTTPGDGGAATYEYDATSTAADDSSFTIDPVASGSGRWKLRIENNGKPTLYQLGGKAEYDYNIGVGFDIFWTIQKAQNNPQTTGLIIDKMPSKTYAGDLVAGKFFYVSDTIKLFRRFELIGAGIDVSVLLAPKGIKTMPGIHGNVFRDFTLRRDAADFSPAINVAGAHGINLQSNDNICERVKVVGYSGNGFNNVADVGAGTNANSNKFTDCLAFGCTNGFYFEGGDANSCRAIGCKAVGNGRWGYWDNSFLGNYASAIECASNTIDHPLNKTIVRKGTNYYICIQNTNSVEPGVTPGWESYWEPRVFFPPQYSTWTAGVQYYTGGGYYISDPNATATFIGCYVENDQKELIANGRTKIVGGTLANYGRCVGCEGTVFGRSNFSKLMVDDGTSPFRFVLDPAARSLTWENSSFSSFGFKGTTGFVGFSYNDGASSETVFLSPGYTAPGDIGRTSITGAGVLQTREIFLGMLGSARSLSMGIAAPTTGFHSAGEMVIYNGTNPSILNFTCIAAGTPGTWTTKYALTSDASNYATYTYVDSVTKKSYASYYDNNSQTFSSSTTPSPITLGTTVLQQGVVISNSEITFQANGVYEVRYSGNATCTGTSANMEVRMQKWNGAAWDNVSGTRIAFTAATGTGIHNAANGYMLQVVAGDKIRFGGTATSTSIQLASGNTDYSFSVTISKK